ncbi:TPA: hypothetical protein PRT52_003915, partial [Escherichia coli]|nr:hypothetical protein [Escherichia coli]
GTPATDLDDDYFDMLQEELCSVVEASGASLEKARHDQLLTALRALLLSRKNPFGDIKSDGTVKTALENLGLGNIHLAGVSTGLQGSNGYWRFPGIISGVKREIIVQFQRITLTSGSYTDPNPLTVSFPIAYPTRCVGVWGMHDDASASVPIGLISGSPVDTLTAKLRAVKLFAASGNGDTYKASVGQSVGTYLLSWGY